MYMILAHIYINIQWSIIIFYHRKIISMNLYIDGYLIIIPNHYDCFTLPSLFHDGLADV